MSNRNPAARSRPTIAPAGAGAPVLVLVKHSLPAIDPATPAPEWPLSEDGRRLAARLRQRLRPYAPARIATSPEPKAAETARIIAGDDPAAPVVVPDLREHERRRVGWLDAAAFNDGVARSLRQPDALVFGEETATAARLRFTAAVDGLLATTPATHNLIVVAHGTVISLFVAQVAGIDPLSLWQRLGLPSYVVLARPALTLIELVAEITGDNRPAAPA